MEAPLFVAQLVQDRRSIVALTLAADKHFSVAKESIYKTLHVVNGV